MSTIPNTGQTQTGAVAHNDLSDSSMATGTEGSAHGQSVDGLDNRGGIDQGKPDLQGKPAPEKGAVASVSNLPVTFEQPDKSPVTEPNVADGQGVKWKANIYSKFTINELLKQVDAGDADAMSELATRYITGEGLPHDFKRARELHFNAASLGSAVSQFVIGYDYLIGDGLPTSEIAAEAFFRLAAAQGYPYAQFELGKILCFSQGAQKDLSKAASLFEMAAASGVVEAERWLEDLYPDGFDVCYDHTDVQKWYLMDAERGDASAQVILAMHYLHDQSTPEDVAEAFKWFGKAAAQGHERAVGVIFDWAHGVGLDMNDTVQAKLHRMAAELLTTLRKV